MGLGFRVWIACQRTLNPKPPLFDHDVVQLLGQAGIDLEGIGKLLDVRILKRV